jgi:TonB-linked SusC/RagA family outer membrane protein
MRKNVFLEHLGKYMPGRLLLAMKLTTLLTLIICMQSYASGFAQQKISLKGTDTSIKNLLKQIEQQTEYRFVYSNNTLPADKKLSVSLSDAYLDEAMKSVLKETSLTYTLKEDNLVVIYSTKGEYKDRVIRGKVIDETGAPLPGVSVKAPGTTIGAVTDANGMYTINVPDGIQTLEFSFLGFTKQVASISGRSVLDISLKSDTRALEEITVTGYTNYSREKSTSAASVVTGDKVAQVPNASLDQILQGRVPGMNVVATSGQPGSSASVTIRGLGTINGSSAPLFVMDGVPIESNYFQTINPNDVETVTVLKDASAKALYGSRGSNGVIVITTKKGAVGNVKVNYNSQYGFSDLTRPQFEMMDTEERLRFEEEIGLETGRTMGPGWTYSKKNPAYAGKTASDKARADFIIDSISKINTDWRDIFFQKSQFMEQQVSLSGGNENIRFYNSLNYYSQEGVAKRTGLDRYALRSNVDYKSGKLSGSVNLNLGYSNSSFTEGVEATAVGSSMASVYYALPYEYPYAPDGTLIHPGNRSQYSIFDLREGSQGLERLLNSSNKADQLKSIMGATFAYQIIPELKATTRFGVDYRNSTDQAFINPDSYYGSRSNSNTLGGKGRFEEGTRRNFNFISTSGLTFNKTVASNHEFEVSGFFEYLYNNFNSFGFTGFGIDGRLPETPAGVTSNATFLPSISGSKTRNAFLSLMGVGRYTFNDKYTLTGSYRHDGSTKVAAKNRYHGFYSAGASWNAKKEDFLQNSSFVTGLVVRASYGTTASPFSGDFTYLPTFGSTTYGGVTGIRPLTPGNPDYDWEYSDEFNTGVDLSLFKSGRLRIVADYYNKITRNLFIDQPLSPQSAYTSLPLSTGKMRNRGIELDINGEIISNSNFSWSMGINGAYNSNKILFLTDIADMVLDGDTRVLKVGMPIGTYYAPDWAGVNPANGDAQYYNLDGTITNVYNANTQNNTNSGSLYPKLTGGLTTNLQYKGLSLSALLSFVSDVKRWNNEDFYNENQRFASSNQTLRMLEERWKKPGDVALLQRFDVPRNFTSKDIQDASFLRLRNVNLSYSLPEALVQKLRVTSGVKLFVQAQNLFTLTSWRGLDPENNNVYGRFQYPAARTYTAGLNVNF